MDVFVTKWDPIICLQCPVALFICHIFLKPIALTLWRYNYYCDTLTFYFPLCGPVSRGVVQGMVFIQGYLKSSRVLLIYVCGCTLLGKSSTVLNMYSNSILWKISHVWVPLYYLKESHDPSYASPNLRIDNNYFICELYQHMNHQLQMHACEVLYCTRDVCRRQTQRIFYNEISWTECYKVEALD